MHILMIAPVFAPSAENSYFSRTTSSTTMSPLRPRFKQISSGAPYLLLAFTKYPTAGMKEHVRPSLPPCAHHQYHRANALMVQ